ncbi:glycosyltransferase [Phytoactinopolyspora halotolerans]|uniref:Glycosyltransferase family 2 protein n=1 Tax=Phytoactinopolyspora halotolerans TaxID=1981512 RepID=A0A6L9S532_9ACTN|nr:glycosyltransferase family 2 protein [Phytoactinopolyspora halotolerans]NED99607.1 glycosyltransferase family 2 protein [Phytoactinopolyspora halotolerans]
MSASTTKTQDTTRTAAVVAPDAVRAADDLGVDSEPDVVVVAVTYNSATIVEPFLRALPAALEGISTARVIIVDNDSSDATVRLVREIAPWATVLKAGGNIGYGAGINLGMRCSNGSQGVLVLNPDTVPAPESVSRLLAATQAAGDVGIAVPRIVDPDGLLSFSLRREPTLLRALGEAVLGGRRAGRFSSFGEMINDREYYTDGARSDWATGAAMFVSRAAIDAAGWWAEDFFLYSEETEYALRVRDAGFGLRFVADAVVAHQGGDMQRSPWLWSLQAVNRTRLYRRRHGRVASAAFWCVVTLNEALRAILGRPKHRAALRALLRGHEAFAPHRFQSSGS